MRRKCKCKCKCNAVQTQSHTTPLRTHIPQRLGVPGRSRSPALLRYTNLVKRHPQRRAPTNIKKLAPPNATPTGRRAHLLPSQPLLTGVVRSICPTPQISPPSLFALDPCVEPWVRGWQLRQVPRVLHFIRRRQHISYHIIPPYVEVVVKLPSPCGCVHVS